MSTSCKPAARDPAADGENTSDTTHDPPTATVAGATGQVEDTTEKSAAFAPVTDKPEIANGAVPELDTDTDNDPLDDPTNTDPNANPETGETDTPATAADPDPDNPNDCGLSPASSTTLMFAVRAPKSIGANVVEIVHDDPAPSVAGLSGHVLEKVKSAEFGPLAASELIVSGAFPAFVSVDDCDELDDPTNTDPNDKLAGESDTTGAEPTPLNPNPCGLPAASSATCTVATREPEAEGVNVAVIAQLEPAASVAGASGHVLATPKSAAAAPIAATPLIVKAAVPVFVSVLVCGALCTPTRCAPKDSEDGASDTVGAVPVPVMAML